MQKTGFKNKSKHQLIFTTPTVGNSSKNVDFKLHNSIGAQMVGMCFQNYIMDRPESLSQITQYHNFFKEKEYTRVKVLKIHLIILLKVMKKQMSFLL